MWETSVKQSKLPNGVEEIGIRRYKIPCECCDGYTIRTQYSPKRQYLCDNCKKVIAIKRKLLSGDFLDTPKEKQFEKAVKAIKSQVKNFDDYEKYIEIARRRTEAYGSVPEVMVAIELLKLGYSITPQQKINNHRVDFAIPKQKLIVEVDGKLYHNKQNEGLREATIQFSLGFDWRIIHIPAEYISKDITKLKTIMAMYKN